MTANKSIKRGMRFTFTDEDEVEFVPPKKNVKIPSLGSPKRVPRPKTGKVKKPSKVEL